MKMIPYGESEIVIEGDNCFCEVPMWDGGDTRYRTVERRLVMTKDAFIKCYKAWILAGDQTNDK